MQAACASCMTERGAHAGAHRRAAALCPADAARAPGSGREQAPNGFAPRFETTMNWAAPRALRPAADDLASTWGATCSRRARLLERAGLGRSADLLAGAPGRGRLAAGRRGRRGARRRSAPAWAAQARAVVAAGFDAPALALEVGGGAHRDGVGRRLGLCRRRAARRRSRAAAGPAGRAGRLAGRAAGAGARSAAGGQGRRRCRWPWRRRAARSALHAAGDPSDEAERAAACVLRHVEAGRVPVALAAIDRVLTRRIRAMLDVRGVAIRDETGWKLSTTRAAAHVMLALRACAWNASSDAVHRLAEECRRRCRRIACSALERRVRRAGLREWRSLRRARLGRRRQMAGRCSQQVERLARRRCRPARPLAAWLAALRELLQATRPMAAAGARRRRRQVIAALRLDDGRAGGEWQQLPQAARRFTPRANSRPGSTTCWRPPASCPSLPAQRAGRDPAVQPVAGPRLRGAGAARLRRTAPAAVARAAGHLDRGAARRCWACLRAKHWRPKQRAGWRSALRTPHCDVLWRRSDDSGEPVLASSAGAGAAARRPRRGRRRPARAARGRARPSRVPSPCRRAAAAGARSFPPAPTRTCAAARIASLRCGNSGLQRSRRNRHRDRQARLRQLAARGARALS